MSRSLREMVRAAQERLERAGIEGAAREARLIAAQAAGIDRARIALEMGEPVAPEAWREMERIARARAARQPLSQLLGYRDFFEHRFDVTPQVLDPRPETETLVRLALERDFRRVLDLGTGSGAIVISLLAARLDATGMGVDLSPGAIGIADANAARIGVAERCRLVVSDWFDAVEGVFDLIVSNPPYIAAAEMAGLAPELAHEPRMALTDEGDGLGAYRAITAGAPAHLAPGGWLMVEIGPTQAAEVAAMFGAAGLENVAIHPDLDGRDRVVSGRMPGKRG